LLHQPSALRAASYVIQFFAIVFNWEDSTRVLTASFLFSALSFCRLQMMGHYAVGKALESAGVVSANDMTLEAISCKVSYLFGRGDLTQSEVASLMGVSLRGEITPVEALSPPPLSSAYQRARRKGKRYY